MSAEKLLTGECLEHQVTLQFPSEEALLSPEEIAVRLVVPRRIRSDFQAIIYISRNL